MIELPKQPYFAFVAIYSRVTFFRYFFVKLTFPQSVLVGKVSIFNMHYLVRLVALYIYFFYITKIHQNINKVKYIQQYPTWQSVDQKGKN